jgi:Tol biopolymer transport system component/PKD repeat protein
MTISTANNSFKSALCALCLVLLPGLAWAAFRPEVITLGMPGGGDSSNASISGDGRYVAFVYTLQPSPYVISRDIYVHDRVSASRKKLTVSASGEAANSGSANPHISSNGRFVVFHSSATNLVPGTSGPGIYVYDQLGQTLEWIARAGWSVSGISADGRYVVYMDDLLKPGTSHYDSTAIFVRDRDTGLTEKLAISPNAGGGMASRDQLSISDDGRYVSYSATRASRATEQGVDAFVYDRASGTSEQLNLMPNGQPDYGTLLNNLTMSGDGRYVSFLYSGQKLVANDDNGVWDVFVRDRQAGTTELVSVFSNGAKTNASNQMATMSANGRRVAFLAYESLDPSSAETTGGIFARDRLAHVTKRAGLVGAGHSSTYPSLSADGRYVAFDYVGPALGTSGHIAVTSLSVPGAVLLSATTLALTEGAADGYALSLASAPSADVVLTMSSDRQVSASPAQLTFTPANWATPQTVTVQAVQDGIVEGEHGATVTHAVASGDTDYNGIGVAGVSVAISEMIVPTLNQPVPAGTVWTNASLPVTGTAAPGASVALTAANQASGEFFAVNASAGADGAWAALLGGLTDGTYILQPQAGGQTGNSVTVIVDSHAPLSTLSVTPAASASGWYGAELGVNVGALDGANGQGVLRSDYTLDGGAISAMPAGGISLSSDGSHTLCYRSLDRANNLEALRCATLAIDTVAPGVTPAFDAQANTLAIAALDTGSGVQGIDTSVDGVNWTPYAGPLGFTRDGSHTVYYRVRDKAGNQNSGQVGVMVVTAPALSAAPDQLAVEGRVASFSLGSFADQGADGPWKLDIDWGDGAVHDGGTIASTGAIGSRSHTYADSGVHAVTVKLTDSAGSMSATGFKVNVGNLAPSAQLTATSAAIEGRPTPVALVNPRDPSGADALAGFHHAFACNGASLAAANYANSAAGASVGCVYDDNGSYTVRARIIDKDDGFTEYSAVVTVINAAPSATLTATGAVNEGGSASVVFSNAQDGSGIDIQAGLRYAFACNGASLAGASYASSGASASTDCVYADGPFAATVRARVFDKDGGYTEYTANVALLNLAPVLGAVNAPAAPLEVHAVATVSAPFSDAGVADTHTGSIDWGDGSVTVAAIGGSAAAGSASGTHAYAVPGIYTVTVKVTDKDGAASSASYQSIVVVDRAGDELSGMGIFGSATGAPGAAGSARLHIKAAYKKKNLTGSVSFDFDAGKLEFQGASYAWLVVNGDKAILRGTGTINGAGNYGFLVSVIDGDKKRKMSDYVRVKIWHIATGTVVYDNQPGAADTANPAMPVSHGKYTIGSPKALPGLGLIEALLTR